MKNEKFEVVIDMIAFNENDGRLTVETFKNSCGQLIFCSTSAVYKRPYKSLPSISDNEIYDANPDFPYGYNKVMLEKYLEKVKLQKNMSAITIIRPSLTFGPGSATFGVLRQNYGVVERIRNGKPLVVNGDGTAPWTFTFAPDMALAFSGSVGNPKTYGQSYQAASEELHVWQDLYVEFGKILGKEPNLFYLPSSVLRNAAPNLCTHLDMEKKFAQVFDMTKTKNDIDYKPKISLNEGLRTLLKYFEDEASVIDPEKEALEDKLYSGWQTLNANLKDSYIK